MSHLQKQMSALIACGLWMAISVSAGAQNAPVLDELESAVVPQVLPVILTGEGLKQEGYPTTVSFNGVPVPPEDFLDVSAVRIVVLAPAAATSGPVQVEVGGALSNAREVTVTAAQYVPDQLIAEPHLGAHGGRLLAMTGLRLIEVVPIGETIFYHLAIDDGRGIPQAIRDLFMTGLVTSVSANFTGSLQDLPSKQNAESPDDPLFSEQYGPQRIRALDERSDTPDAQRLATGKGKIISIIDSGIDHEQQYDLIFKVIDEYDYIHDDPAADDEHGHGTHVAGIAAAKKGLVWGIVGIAPDAELLAMKVADATGKDLKELHVAKAIRDSVAKGAHIINLSLRFPDPVPVMKQALEEALTQNVFVVAAAGNTGDGNPATLDPAGYPAGFSDALLPSGIMAVGNSDKADQIYARSTNQHYVDLAAPGTDILSSLPNFQHGKMTGTSMAAPHVSGVAALMLEVDPNLSPSQLECLMELTAVDRGTPGKDIAFGHGRVDAYAAVHAVQSLGGRYHLLPRECNVIFKPPNGGGFNLPFPAIGIIKVTNAVHANNPPGPFVFQGNPVVWTYLVWNAGNVPLANIQVNDNRIGAINCPGNQLNSGQFMVCVANGIAAAGQYANQATVTAQDPLGFPVVDIDKSHYFGVPLPPPPDPPVPLVSLYGQGWPNQILAVTADSLTALVATFPEKTVKIDLQTRAVTEFGGFPARPASDVVVAPDQEYALVVDFPGSEQAVFGLLRRIHLVTGEEKIVALHAPVTEITVTADGSQALIGTTWGLEIVDLATMTTRQLREVRAITGISITADGSKALVGVPQGIAVINLPSGTWTLLPIGPIFTGIALSGDNATAVAGVAGGVVLVDLESYATTLLGTGTPVSSILLTPDNNQAVFAALFGAVIVDLAAKTYVQVPAPPVPVTDIELSTDGSVALFGSTAGLTMVDLANRTHSTIALPLPAVTGLSLSPDSLWAVVGISGGIAIVDLQIKDVEIVQTLGMPITNVAITPDSMTGLVGIPSGIVIVDLPTATADVLGTAYPLVTPSITPDGSKAIFGTLEGISIIDIGENTVEKVYDSPPILNLLPNSGQPPLNPAGERGNPGPSDG